jgi:hypothetical protein
MSASTERIQVYKEIDRIPEERLPEIYSLLHHFRPGLEKAEEPASSVMRFAGSWKDMPDETFAAFTQEVVDRRQRAFSRRRNGESCVVRETRCSRSS